MSDDKSRRETLDGEIGSLWLDYSPAEILQSLADKFSGHGTQMAGSDYSELELCTICGIGDILAGLATFAGRWFDELSGGEE